MVFRRLPTILLALASAAVAIPAGAEQPAAVAAEGNSADASAAAAIPAGAEQPPATAAEGSSANASAAAAIPAGAEQPPTTAAEGSSADASAAAAIPAGAGQPPATAAEGSSVAKPANVGNADPAGQSTSTVTRAPRRRGQTENQPAKITADLITHDRDLNTVTARGHVQVDQGGRVLLTDTLSYNLKQDVIIATGNVSLTEATGEVTFSDYMELTGDMKTAAADGIRYLMIDDSRLAAKTGHRVAGDRSVFTSGIYTACEPCAEDPTKAPLWQVRANRITHDEVAHKIEYEDAWLEFAGVPVAYTPYMSHADPTVKRESGLLPPSVLNNNIIGSGVRTPYFQVISPYQDITLTPMISNNDYEQLQVLHRWRSELGETKTVASITDMPQSVIESRATVGWHIDAYSQFSLNDTWRAGYQIQRTSDQYYLETMGYHTPEPYLTTRPYVENFDYRNYAAVEGYSFQSLTTQPVAAGAPQPQKDPVVFPMATYSYVGEPSANGSYWSFDTRAASINREEGTSSRRVNTLTGWNLPYTAPDGEVYRFSASVRADGYNSNNIQGINIGSVNTGRAVPDVAVDWRYPFTTLGEHSSQTISPIIMATASPYGGNSLRIPNEDSLDFELDETNIFKVNPSNGYDRVLTGPRVAYGGQYTVVNRGLGSADIVLAQTYQTHPQDVFAQGTGLDHHLSDIVGRTNVSPSSNFSMQYGFRLAEDTLALRRSEVTTSFGPRPLNLQTSYVFYDRLSPTSPFDAREQLSSTLTAQLSHHWSSQVYTINDLGAGAGPLQTGVRLTYEDECFLITGDAGDRHTTVKTFSAGHYFLFRIYFKTLAQFPVDVF